VTPTSPSPTPAGRLLDVEHLKVSFRTEEGVVQAVDDVSFTLDPGEMVGIVGESGSGKSVTAMTLMGLTRGPNATFSGHAMLGDLDLITASEQQLRRIRGRRIAMIFQDPMTALNPVYRVGDQIVEQIRVHEKVSKAAAYARAVDLLDRVGIPMAKDRARSFPHEFSGGMRQRVMIAMALSCSPEILVADEPTTALDVTIQAQILAEIETLRKETGVGVILITHDLGVIADVADRVVVMYAGRVVEQGNLDEIFYDPLHPYTWGLLGSVPRVDKDRPGRLPTIPGSPPSLLHPPGGCHFSPRCPWRFDQCAEVPQLRSSDWESPEHLDRCWLDLADKRERRYVGDAIGLPARPQATETAVGSREPETS
jgi:peptide/nickel transport system ATP-binding protein